MKTFHFRIQDRRIDSAVHCGENICRTLLGKRLKTAPSRVLAVIDANVSNHYRDYLATLLPDGIPLYVFPSGEKNKSEKRLLSILEWFYANQADRKSLVIAIGGGVVTDIVGFAAACYMRGIEYVSIPTTLVAQVDAAIGGKTAINFRATKNIVGAFYPPSMVICDSHFLKTLGRPQIKEGLIEAIKIFAACDRKQFHRYASQIESLSAGQGISPLIADAVKLKLAVVNRDPFEKDLRRVLNFGHTTGHAYEVLTGEPHGKSVAFGILVALTLSQFHVKLSNKEAALSREAILSIYRRFALKKISANELWEKILHDKKRIGGAVHFVLLKKCGEHTIKPLNYNQFERGFSETVESLRS